MLALLTSVLFSFFFFLTLLHYGLKELAQIRKVEHVPAVKPFPIFGNIFDIIMTPSEYKVFVFLIRYSVIYVYFPCWKGQVFLALNI